MIHRFGANPFCQPHSTAPVGAGTFYPVGFREDEIVDMFHNVAAFRFNFIGAADINPGIIGGIGDILSGGLGAIGSVGDSLGFGGSIAETGFTSRVVGQRVQPPPGFSSSEAPNFCNDVVHRRQSGRVVFHMDFARAIYRADRRLYYPLLFIRFISNEAAISTRPFLGGGNTAGGVTFNGWLVEFFSERADALPITFNGEIRGARRYDWLEVQPANPAPGSLVLVRAVRGGETLSLSGVNQVWFGDLPAAHSVNQDTLIVNVPLTARGSQPWIFQTQSGDLFSTRRHYRTA